MLLGKQLRRQSTWGCFLNENKCEWTGAKSSGILLPLAWRTWSRLHYSQGHVIAQDSVTGHGTSPRDPNVYMRFSSSMSLSLLGGLCPRLT